MVSVLDSPQKFERPLLWNGLRYAIANCVCPMEESDFQNRKEIQNANSIQMTAICACILDKYQINKFLVNEERNGVHTDETGIWVKHLKRKVHVNDKSKLSSYRKGNPYNDQLVTAVYGNKKG
jgi:hypothetical protein